jgi:hypothetical protein
LKGDEVTAKTRGNAKCAKKTNQKIEGDQANFCRQASLHFQFSWRTWWSLAFWRERSVSDINLFPTLLTFPMSMLRDDLYEDLACSAFLALAVFSLSNEK